MDNIEYLTKRSIYILEFLMDHSINKDIYSEVINKVKESSAKKSIRSLTMLSRDINAWANGLPISAKNELELKLKDLFGDNLIGDNTLIKKIEKILKRGKIINLSEYKLIHQYTQDISEGDILFYKLSEFENMLYNYNANKRIG